MTEAWQGPATLQSLLFIAWRSFPTLGKVAFYALNFDFKRKSALTEAWQGPATLQSRLFIAWKGAFIARKHHSIATKDDSELQNLLTET